MRKTLTGILVAIIAAFATQTVQAQNIKALPDGAKSYISRHFENCTVNHYEKEADLLDIEHKVYLNYNGVSFVRSSTSMATSPKYGPSTTRLRCPSPCCR